MSALDLHPNLRQRTVVITGGAAGIGSLVEHFIAPDVRAAFVDIDAAAGAMLAGRLQHASAVFGANQHLCAAPLPPWRR